MANIDVTITSPTATSSKIDVGSIRVGKNDTITWINNTGDVVVLFFPHDKMANSQNHFYRTIQDQESDVIKITTGIKRPYRYGGFSHPTNSLPTGPGPQLLGQ